MNYLVTKVKVNISLIVVWWGKPNLIYIQAVKTMRLITSLRYSQNVRNLPKGFKLCFTAINSAGILNCGFIRLYFFNPGQIMWVSWWTKCHWGRCFSQY
jgi:hypothetical protein